MHVKLPSRLGSAISMYSPRGQMCRALGAILYAPSGPAGMVSSLYPWVRYCWERSNRPAFIMAVRIADAEPSTPMIRRGRSEWTWLVASSRMYSTPVRNSTPVHRALK